LQGSHDPGDRQDGYSVSEAAERSQKDAGKKNVKEAEDQKRAVESSGKKYHPEKGGEICADLHMGEGVERIHIQGRAGAKTLPGTQKEQIVGEDEKGDYGQRENRERAGKKKCSATACKGRCRRQPSQADEPVNSLNQLLLKKKLFPD